MVVSSNLDGITQLHLKSFGFSDYLVRQIVKSLKASNTADGFKEYAASDAKASIEAKLSNPKTQQKSKEQLQRILAWLKGESNVIEVDFLRRLPPEKRIEVLNARIEELDAQERVLVQETDKLLRKAKKIVNNK